MGNRATPVVEYDDKGQPVLLDKNLKPALVGAGLYNLKRAGSVGIFVHAGRMANDFNNTSAYTWEDVWELPGEFDWVAPVWAQSRNAGGTTASPVMLASLAVVGDPSPAAADAAAWTAATVSNGGTWNLTVGPSASRRAFVVGDRINLSSVPRTDGGSKALIACRTWVNGGASLQLRGNGADSFTNWATRADGRMRRTRKAAGNYASANQTTMTANQVGGYANESPLVGFLFGARGRVVNAMRVGDSIDEGRGTYIGDGMLGPAVASLAREGGPIYCESNLAWSGMASVNFFFHASDAFAAGLVPDILCWPVGSPNDFTTGAITAAQVATARQWSARTAGLCRDNNVSTLQRTIMPSNYAIKPYGASDSLRRDYNAAQLALAAGGLPVMDVATPAVLGVDGNGQQLLLSSAGNDGIHPDDALNALVARDVVAPALAQFS